MAWLMAPLCAYAAILYAALLHLEEARIVLITPDADRTIAIGALLRLISNRYALAGVMTASAVLALTALRDALSRRLSTISTIAMLLPQQVLLLTTSIAAWLAVWHGVYADEVDQLPRGMFAILHMTGMVSVAFYLARKAKATPGNA